MSAKNIFLVFFFFIFNVVDVSYAQDPRTKTCSMRNPNRNSCVKDVVQASLSSMDGSLGTPQLDPYYFDRLILPFDHSLIRGEVVAINLKFVGMKDISVENVEIYEEGQLLNVIVEMVIPDLVILNDYSAKGTVIAIPIIGAKGSSVSQIKNALLRVHITATPRQKNGKEYLRVTSVQTTLEPTDFDDFTANGISSFEFVNDLIVNFYRSNGPIIVPVYGKACAPVWTEIMEPILNGIFSKVPYSLH